MKYEPPVSPASAQMTYVVGAASRLFRSLDWPDHFVEISGRAANFAAMPRFPPRSIVVVFADPPDETQTRALMLSLLACIEPGTGTRIVFASSIAAGFKDARVTFEGRYARKKRIAEEILLRADRIDVVILRIGNVFSHGGWLGIQERCALAIMPGNRAKTAQSSVPEVRACLLRALALPPGKHFVQAWAPCEAEDVFRHVFRIDGLARLYQVRFLQPCIKVISRLLRLAHVYLPTPDDVNAFLVVEKT